jgi:exonuclease VII small subunit
MSKKAEKKNLNKNLKRLSDIAEWFENQEEIDVEEGLDKVKEAAELIKISKERLKEIENEFEEIKRTIDQEIGVGEEEDGGSSALS